MSAEAACSSRSTSTSDEPSIRLLPEPRVSGATRFGEGVTSQSWANQTIQRGDAACMFDPRGDEFLPVIMRPRAEEMGRTFLVINPKDHSYGGRSPLEHGKLKDRAVPMRNYLTLLSLFISHDSVLATHNCEFESKPSDITWCVLIPLFASSCRTKKRQRASFISR